MRRYLNRSLLAAAVVFVAGCNLDVPAPGGSSSPSDPATETFNLNFKGVPVDVSKMKKTVAGDYYQDVTVGSGAALTFGLGQQAFLSLKGYLKSGFAFAQAVNQLTVLGNLPPGLVDGMAGMNEGGERIIVVPSALGYGPVPQPSIPPNSTLVFDVIINQIP
jgi:FKBP-type peptidyl-prolyl cis-trans isomerase